MLTSTQIVDKMNETRCDTDLGLIYDMWADEACNQDEMRASDQNVIRKAAAAIDRVGYALARHINPNAAMAHQILPEITRSTRVRKTPERFWMEIDVNGHDKIGANHSVVFVEFSKSQIKFGVRLPTTSDATEVDEFSKIDVLESLDAKDIAAWHIEQRRPPAEGAACSRDLNVWLAGRAVAQQQNDLFLTLSKTYSVEHPLMKNIIAGLKQASQICGKINANSEIWTHPGNPNLASHVEHMI
jgi:hypothetical protein